MEQKKPPKRLDLQGIRALAIIAVLGFHFFPKYIPNGYLGVDQFFVLSGFLMCMLLRRTQDEPACSLLALFYSKRFKRIFPLYLLIIAVSIIALYTIFPSAAIATNRESAVSALLFVSNRPKTEMEDYFQRLSVAIDIFTHTWSLSVEVQFYLLVPLIFLIGKRLSTKYQLTFYVFLASSSYVFSFFSSPIVAFNSVFARVWQFFVGFLVYLLTSSNEDEQQYELLSVDDVEKLLPDEESLPENLPEPSQSGLLPNVIFIGITALTMCPLTLPADVLRPLVTVITGLLMMVSERSSVLSNSVLTYLGDISYSLYLIHWPIYAYWKLTANGDQFDLFLALIGSIFLAVLCYEAFEKWYLKLSSASVCALVLLLFLLNVLLINKDHFQDHFIQNHQNITSLDKVTDNMTIDDAERMNEQWNRDDVPNIYSPSCAYEKPRTPFGWCRHQGLSPNGQYKLAIIGSSWAPSHGTLFYQECGYRARSILQGSYSTCEVLYPTQERPACTDAMNDSLEHIQVYQPDYAFVFNRYLSIGDPMPKNVTNLEDDPIYLIMKNQTSKLLANIKRKLFILDAVPRVFSKNVSQIVPMLRKHKSPVEIDKEIIEPHDPSLAHKRYALLVKEFKERVVLVDYKPEFYNNSTKTYRYFDNRGFSYFTSSNHLSPHGLEYVRHVWTDICRSL